MLYRTVPIALLWFATAANPVSAGDTVADALAGGETSLSFRLRHELVEDDAFAADANASTLRTRLGYTSGQWRGLDLTLELDHVSQLFDHRANDTRNGETAFPGVPDPKGTDLNQAALRYRHGEHSAVAGRQRIALDNQRFIGSVGWRQNEQTYDALRLSLKPLPTLALDYAWINRTRRIFGPDSGSPQASLGSDHHLAHLQWSGSKALNAGAYYYLLDFAEAAALSSRTIGGSARGETTVGKLALDYRLEAARQRDASNNPVNYEADYSLVSAGVTVQGLRLGAALETLGADRNAGVALQTPLATLHAFQGWSDKFLVTPAGGVRDTYVSVSGALAGVQLQATWHQYRSDSSALDLGKELNLVASRSFAGRYTLTAKYADYRADTFSSDTRKFWVVAEAKL